MPQYHPQCSGLVADNNLTFFGLTVSKEDELHKALNLVSALFWTAVLKTEQHYRKVSPEHFFFPPHGFLSSHRLTNMHCVVSFLTPLHFSTPQLFHGVFHLFISEGVDEGIEHRRDDGVEHGDHLVCWGGGGRAHIDENAWPKEQNYNSDVGSTRVECFETPFGRACPQRNQDNTIGHNKNNKRAQGNHTTIGSHTDTDDVGVSAGQLH